MAETITYPTDSDWHSGFILPALTADEQMAQFEAIHRDLRVMSHDGPSRLALITDLEGVWTALDSDGIHGSTWGILSDHMTEPNRERHAELFDIYHPKEKAGTLTPKESDYWQTEAHKCLVGISLSAVLEDLSGRIRLNPGAEDLYELCKSKGVWLQIRSTAFGQIARAAMKETGIAFDDIRSNELVVDEKPPERPILGVDPDSYTHSFGKSRHRHRHLPGAHKRTNIITAGDHFHDAKIVDPADDELVLAIAVSDKQAMLNPDDPAYRKTRANHAQAGNRLIAVRPGLVSVDGLVRAITEDRLAA